MIQRQDSFVHRFNLSAPIVLAPMGGGPSTPELVAAVSNAGGLGSLAAAYLSPQQITEAIAKTSFLTSRPFAVNLFTKMPDAQATREQVARAVDATRAFRDELGLPEPTVKPPYHQNFDEQFIEVMKAKPAIFSFVFGLLEGEYVRECKKQGIYTMGTATTLDEALALEFSGVDALVCQGTEAGAHRGIFSPVEPEPGIKTAVLVRKVSEKVSVPVIGAGGLMTGHDITAILKAGAQAAMLGTAFLLCPEAGTSKPYREALRVKKNSPTKLTRAFSGRLARGLENRFITTVDGQPDSILPFPMQNAFTRDIRTKASALGNSEFLSLWAGTGLAQIRELPAAELVRVLQEEIIRA